MKRLFIALFMITSLSACNDNAENTSVNSKEKDSDTTSQAANMEAEAAKMQEKVESLKKLEPMTTDQVKELMPASLMGIKRSDYNATTAMGFAMGEATYKENDSTYLKVSLFDVAGEAGSGIYGMQYWSALNMQQERNDGYIKTIEFKGGKAIEKFDENDHTYELLYMGNERLMVNITGVNTTLNMVKQAAGRLHF
jgi:hypothetical protein